MASTQTGRGSAAPAPQQRGSGAGRAGRDLPAAIGVSVGLGAVILGSLFVKGAFAVVVGVAVLVGVRELATALAGRACASRYSRSRWAAPG